MKYEKQELSSKHTFQSYTPGRVQYVPPDAIEIERFTTKVCDTLVRTGRSEFASNNVRWNITNLLKLIAELTAKRMNGNQVNI